MSILYIGIQYRQSCSQALTLWVDQGEQRHRLTLEALADVDAGKTIDHDEVENWIESLGTNNSLPLPSCG